MYDGEVVDNARHSMAAGAGGGGRSMAAAAFDGGVD